MTFSVFRSKWVFGTSISMSTTIASFRTSFFHFSIKAPPFPLLYRKRGILLKFFDKLAPREGSDPPRTPSNPPQMPFLSTLPARGATKNNYDPRRRNQISTHAPREGSDG